MNSRLKDKIALITGAARGIGEACARLFAKEGARVVLTDINDGLGQQVAQEIGISAFYKHLDMGQESQWQTIISWMKSEFGCFDILINNAAVTGINSNFGSQNPEYCSLESWREIHKVNLDSVFLGSVSV